MRFLSGLQNEGIVFSQRKRVGGEFVQFQLPEADRRLHLAPCLHLAQNVGNVVGAESAGGMGLLHRGGCGFRSVVANQFEQLADLPGEGAIGAGEFTQI
jgi:hypothetical protein